ncbi:TetR/AcrR family transcriptional regulator [Mycolicibacterium chubuense]|uniref:TetR/AcrR family transcriptional regulator n=1 Tax=Mycolicibacterium chubuense TaxID=1800 RepID=UPI0003105C9F|nr:TetR/AcrR family transcriptional regulator [Mycolicibacterium chubuense]
MQNESGHDAERRNIIEAAYCCLSEPHTAPIPVTTILRRAGVSSRAFYRHFGSKDDLFLALLRRECDALAARLDRIADEAVGEPADQLAEWVGEMFTMVTEPHQRTVMAVVDSDEVRAARGYREIRGCAHEHRERSLIAILRRGRRDGSFPLAEPDADAVAISAVLSRVLSTQAPDDLQAVKQAQGWVLDFALRAVGAVRPA